MKNSLGLDEVAGVVIGDMSYRYGGYFKTVETWVQRKESTEYPVKRHEFWSEKITRREAVADYIAKQHRAGKLGDGSDVVWDLVEACPTCQGEHPIGCCAQDGKD